MREFRIEADFIFNAKSEKDSLLKLSRYFLALYQEDEEKENKLQIIVGSMKLNEVEE